MFPFIEIVSSASRSQPEIAKDPRMQSFKHPRAGRGKKNLIRNALGEPLRVKRQQLVPHSRSLLSGRPWKKENFCG